ncbi:MAG: glycogen debranching enzyme GlgX, partial [Proteobacteria bacterium]|nr:glycogen debranching enzyme GlgX [Pseudomonadota bacterium]
SHNLSRNCGVEGDTDDAAVLAERARLSRVLLAALLLSQGTPMLLAGDELGHSQRGNNNAYCQDNDITWLDWVRADGELTAFVARALALRREAAPLRSTHWWPAQPQPDQPALRWLAPEGRPMTTGDWQAPGRHAMAVLFETPGMQRQWLVLVNAQEEAVRFTLPPGRWHLRLATDAKAHGADSAGLPLAHVQEIPPTSLWVASG